MNSLTKKCAKFAGIKTLKIYLSRKYSFVELKQLDYINYKFRKI